MRSAVPLVFLLAACSSGHGTSGGSGFADMAFSAAGDLAFSAYDAAAGGGDMGNVTSDLGGAPRSDLGSALDGGQPRFGCSSDFTCRVMQHCADQQCIAMCDAMVNTMDGLRLLREYLACPYALACPNRNGG